MGKELNFFCKKMCLEQVLTTFTLFQVSRAMGFAP